MNLVILSLILMDSLNLLTVQLSQSRMRKISEIYKIIKKISIPKLFHYSIFFSFHNELLYLRVCPIS